MKARGYKTYRMERVGDKGVECEFSPADLRRLEVAVRLREESARDAEDLNTARLWAKVHRKIMFLLQWKE